MLTHTMEKENHSHYCYHYYLPVVVNKINTETGNELLPVPNQLHKDRELANLVDKMIQRSMMLYCIAPYFVNCHCYTYKLNSTYYYYSAAIQQGNDTKDSLELGEDDVWFKCIIDQLN